METKNFKLATRFSAILEVHKNLLFIKQYSENMIGSRQRPGQFSYHLQEAFRKAYTTDIDKYRIHEFTLQLSGYFSAAKDPVDFEFTYAYDPYNVRLNLRQMKATLRDEFSKTYRIKSHPSRDLPPSAKVYEELCAIRNAERIKEEPDPQKVSGRRKTI